jgi:hypothetical protein
MSRKSRHVFFSVALTSMVVFAAYARDVYINPNFPISGQRSDGRTTLSPPVIAAVDSCSTHVYVESFIPKATVRVILNGSTVIGVAIPEFGFVAVKVTKVLQVGDKLTATQTVNGLTSAPSNPATVVAAMPMPLPAPSVNLPIYACGHVAAVGGLLPGVSVSVSDQTVGNAVIGTGFTPNDWGSTWDPVVTSPLVAGHQVTANQSACMFPASSGAPPQTVSGDPSPMLAPQLDPPIVGNDALTLHGLYTGAQTETGGQAGRYLKKLTILVHW